jgi:hypothetical protein
MSEGANSANGFQKELAKLESVFIEAVLKYNCKYLMI